MTRILLLLAIASTGCLRSTTFQCETSAQCGSEGICETDKYCSFPSSSCPSGRVYGDNSGPSSNECVGGMPNDGGTEPIMGGEMTGGEPPAGNCPATGYATLPNSGPRGHRYKFLNTDAAWSTHRDACAAEGTYMAFPDGTSSANAAMELAALRVLAADQAWVGVNDIANEGVYRTSLNLAASTSTQSLISIAGNPNGTDCFVINNTTLDDASCNDTRKAVCECVP